MNIEKVNRCSIKQELYLKLYQAARFAKYSIIDRNGHHGVGLFRPKLAKSMAKQMIQNYK